MHLGEHCADNVKKTVDQRRDAPLRRQTLLGEARCHLYDRAGKGGLKLFDIAYFARHVHVHGVRLQRQNADAVPPDLSDDVEDELDDAVEDARKAAGKVVLRRDVAGLDNVLVKVSRNDAAKDAVDEGLLQEVVLLSTGSVSVVHVDFTQVRLYWELLRTYLQRVDDQFEGIVYSRQVDQRPLEHVHSAPVRDGNGGRLPKVGV